jgi:hypothetical protein
MKSRVIYGVIVLGLCAAAVTVVRLKQSQTVGISRKHAALDRTRLAHAATPRLAPAARQRMLERYARMALRFEAQHEPRQTVYTARGSGYSLLLRPTEAVWALEKSQGRQENDGRRSNLRPVGFQLAGPQEIPRSSTGTAVVRMELVGANPAARMVGGDKLPGRVNYYLGNDATKWRTNVPTYAKVHCQDVYAGVDLVYYGDQGRLEYDFVIAPRAEPKAIKLRFEGAGKPEVDAAGNLVLRLAAGEVVQHAPRIYQEIDGGQRAVQGGYVVAGEEVGFQVAAYDATKPLVIDPYLVYSTFLGGRLFDQGQRIAVDAEGNACVVGYITQSIDFPTENPFQPEHGGGFNFYDLFVTKFDASGGSLIYSTYLGGRGDDAGSGIAVDGEGNAYVTGYTDSPNFPTVKAFQPALRGRVNAFVTKFDVSGSVVYSTYLGGSDIDSGNAIAVDAEGSAYVTGSTWSRDFPTENPFQATLSGQSDVFVSKFDASGAVLVYSTYLGGAGRESTFGIAVDAEGNAYLTGQTNSINFPTVNAFQPAYGGGLEDGFVTKFDASGSALVYSTYLGGGAWDAGIGIALDAQGNAYVAGGTDSPDFPAVKPFQADLRGGSDAFVTKLDPTGGVVYSTYLGGNRRETGEYIAVDAKGQAYITGDTESPDFPTMDPVQPVSGGGLDVFVTQLDASRSSLVFSTYLGGNDDEVGFGIALDAEGNIYVTGLTHSSDFPTVKPFQAGPAGGGDGFVTKISLLEIDHALPNR